MSKVLVGQYVVFWGSGGPHHIFKTLEEAEKYCRQAAGNPMIAKIVARTETKIIKNEEK